MVFGCSYKLESLALIPGPSWLLLFDSHRQLSDCVTGRLTFGIREPRLRMGYASVWYRPMHPRF